MSTRRAVASLALTGLLGWSLPALGSPETEPPTIVGAGELRIADGGASHQARLIFAAAADPLALRLEVVRAGSMIAIVWFDEEQLHVTVPGRPARTYAGPATRETLDTALGLPFCPDELVFALRGGLARLPRCAPQYTVVRKRDRIVELVRPSDGVSPGGRLRFGKLVTREGWTWPKKAVLDSGDTTMTLILSTIEGRDRLPTPPKIAQGSEPISAEELRRRLGLAPESEP